jgi:replicative DNA helicase
LVVVDGAYLLGGTSYQRRYETIAESATFLKQKIATNRGIPVMASYQFNKEGAKTKKGEEAVVQDLAGSMEIGNLATVVLGLFQGDTPETIRKRKINVLKGRNGEVGQFYVNWDFVNMDFDEVGEEDDLLQIT